jgi:hypothetical protein
MNQTSLGVMEKAKSLKIDLLIREEGIGMK